MSKLAIKADHLKKKYRIGQRTRYRTVRESISNLFRKPIKRFESNIIWALDDVSFEIHQGEAVGIIGKNGSGKSTLLKVLSQITSPTDGYAKIYGRAGTLLEVGTGFHPELTGRENIFLNGAILGMKKKEINRKLDEIVSFSEVEKFLDTPVKRYSSGMYVRLAFAVAAHLEPEILLVDEVLAVGDTAFQNKCLGKMDDVVTKEGRTVLFVSHNMASISVLCKRGILLNNGKVESIGDIQDVIEHYYQAMSHYMSQPIMERKDRQGTGLARIVDIKAHGSEYINQPVITGIDCAFDIEYESKSLDDIGNVKIGIIIQDNVFKPVTILQSDFQQDKVEHIPPKGIIRCHIPHLPLMQGHYILSVYMVVAGEFVDYVREAKEIEISAGDYFGTGFIPSKEFGNTLVDQHWSLLNRDS